MPEHSTSAPAAEAHRDDELRQLLAVTADTDRGESPFGWSDHPTPTPQDNTHTEVDGALD